MLVRSQEGLFLSSFRPGLRTVREAFKKGNPHSAKLDFDARVPIPVSVFPSTWRGDNIVTEEIKVKVEGEASLPARGGREGHESRFSYSASTDPGRNTRETRTYEENRVQRPGRREENIRVYKEEDRERREYRDIDLETTRSR